jgi:CheY-like chemotaxis protein
MKKAVVVDDEELNRNVVSRMLSVLGYECYTAQNGEQGAEAVKEHNPDLVVTDLMMPVKDGIYVVEQAKAYNPDIPVIIASGQDLQAEDSRQEKIKQAEEAGVYFLQKPFGFSDLQKAIEAVLGHSLLEEKL